MPALCQTRRPREQIVIHDVDFTPLALAYSTTSEARGLAVVADVMTAAAST
jgi:hypothetical protein